jgi:hypothetical protein
LLIVDVRGRDGLRFGRRRQTKGNAFPLAQARDPCVQSVAFGRLVNKCSERRSGCLADVEKDKWFLSRREERRIRSVRNCILGPYGAAHDCYISIRDRDSDQTESYDRDYDQTQHRPHRSCMPLIHIRLGFVSLKYDRARSFVRLLLQ